VIWTIHHEDSPEWGFAEGMEGAPADPRHSDAERMGIVMSSAVHLPPRAAPEPAEPGVAGRAPTSGSIGDYPQLARQFRMIVFDWDGTAVTNRQEDASALAHLAEPLLADGCWLVVVTGTSFDHIARQFCDLVEPACRQRLVVCANRGSEVYSFDERGETMPRFRRAATPEEERALTAIAEAVRDELNQTTDLDTRTPVLCITGSIAARLT
jgi:hypothetical protein